MTKNYFFSEETVNKKVASKKGKKKKKAKKEASTSDDKRKRRRKAVENEVEKEDELLNDLEVLAEENDVQLIDVSTISSKGCKHLSLRSHFLVLI